MVIVRTAFLYLVILFFCSCGAREATLQREKILLMDKGKMEISAPGITFEVVIPKVERPRAQTKVYTGSYGAKSIASFDKDGIITNILTICPDLKIIKEENFKLQSKLKEKDIERKGISFGQLLLWILGGLIVGFIIGWSIRGRLKIPGLN